MKALIPALLLLSPVAFAADEANSGIGLGFEVGTSYYVPAQKPISKGLGNFFAVDLNLGSVSVGYYFEALNLKAKDDSNNDGVDARLDGDVAINALRLTKPIPGVEKFVAIGVAVGMADVKLKNAATGASVVSELAPMAEIFGKVTPISGGDKVKAAVNVVLGYRFITIDSRAPAIAPDFADPVDNLNGFRVGVSVSVAF